MVKQEQLHNSFKLKFENQIVALSILGMLLLCSCSTNTLESFDWKNGSNFTIENGIVSRNGFFPFRGVHVLLT